MHSILEKILEGFIIVCIIALFVAYGVIFYKAATGDDRFFTRKVYIVNQDFCKEAK